MYMMCKHPNNSNPRTGTAFPELFWQTNDQNRVTVSISTMVI
jgi:hypothetical protein